MSEGSQVSVYATNYNVLRISRVHGGFGLRVMSTLLTPLYALLLGFWYQIQE
jgi:hypothetical protein